MHTVIFKHHAHLTGLSGRREVIGGAIQRGRVSVMDDGQKSWGLLRRVAVNRGDAAAPNGAHQSHSVGHVPDGMIGGIARLAGDLEDPIFSADRRTNSGAHECDSGFCAAWANARTMARLASSIL